METLRAHHNRLIDTATPSVLQRPLGLELNWGLRLSGILGTRGVGKTTLMLNHLKETHGRDPSALYVSLDNIYFNSNPLFDTASDFYNSGGKYLFLDEVHRYQNWSQEIKNLYDSFPAMKIVFTGSSILHLIQGQADLSRRARIYRMEGLSFREFVNAETKLSLPHYSLSDITGNHVSIAGEITAQVKPLAHFQAYLQHGYYPFYLEDLPSYPDQLMATINLVLDVDLPLCRAVDVNSSRKLKRLLYMIATTAPMTPNVSKISAGVEVARKTLPLYFDYLHDAQLVNLLRSAGKGYSQLAKPAKIYLHNTNLAYAIAPQIPDKGTLRETFFLNQLSSRHTVNHTDIGNFLVDNSMIFEIGGRSKKGTQLKDAEKGFVAADDIEVGYGNKIPLWLFGFLR
ncbi:MAG: AAA family ATPase [Bacteroidia bacterium]